MGVWVGSWINGNGWSLGGLKWWWCAFTIASESLRCRFWLIGEHSTFRGRWFFSNGSHFRGWFVGGGIRHSFVGGRLWLLVTGRSEWWWCAFTIASESLRVGFG